MSLLPRRNVVTNAAEAKGKTAVVEPPKTLYVHVRCGGDLNECLNQLWVATAFARNNRREIVFEMTNYSGDIATLVDFAKYPVKVYTNAAVLPAEATRAPFEPEGKSKAEILVHDKTGGGLLSAHVFRYIRLKPTLVETLKGLPVLHSAFHVASTEPPADVMDIDAVVKDFVTSQRSRPLFLVTENEKKQTQYVKKYGCFTRPAVSEGKPVLAEALLDLLVMAAAKDLLCVPGADGNVSGIATLARELQTKRLFVRDLVAGKPMA